MDPRSSSSASGARACGEHAVEQSETIRNHARQRFIRFGDEQDCAAFRLRGPDAGEHGLVVGQRRRIERDGLRQAAPAVARAAEKTEQRLRSVGPIAATGGEEQIEPEAVAEQRALKRNGERPFAR